jgi:hypothetical protein
LTAALLRLKVAQSISAIQTSIFPSSPSRSAPLRAPMVRLVTAFIFPFQIPLSLNAAQSSNVPKGKPDGRQSTFTEAEAKMPQI